jgi:hypothetical protein
VSGRPVVRRRWRADGEGEAKVEVVANPPGRKLKVFQAQLGFHESVVAAPSQAAALRAWGVQQNLFAEGQARVSDDPQATAAARAHPGTPLRRAVGTRGAFELNPDSLPDIPDAPRRKATRAVPSKPVPAKPPADRSELDAAEAALRALDARRKREEARLRARQADLDQQVADRQAAYVAERKAAATAVAAHRQAYRRAGGED